LSRRAQAESRTPTAMHRCVLFQPLLAMMTTQIVPALAEAHMTEQPYYSYVLYLRADPGRNLVAEAEATAMPLLKRHRLVKAAESKTWDRTGQAPISFEQRSSACFGCGTGPGTRYIAYTLFQRAHRCSRRASRSAPARPQRGPRPANGCGTHGSHPDARAGGTDAVRPCRSD
jgi:hypothetical protein